jgi:hypothetical protein
MGVICPSETYVHIQKTRRYISENGKILSYRFQEPERRHSETFTYIYVYIYIYICTAVLIALANITTGDFIRQK